MNRSRLNLFANGEEGAKGVIHRLGVREVLHDIRIKNCDVRTLLEQVGILAANCVGVAAVPEVSGFFVEFSLGWSSEPGADDMDKTVCFLMATNSRRFSWTCRWRQSVRHPEPSEPDRLSLSPRDQTPVQASIFSPLP
jgi:hypothetical protein